MSTFIAPEQAPQITAVLSNWLGIERINAMSSNNRILDDLNHERSGLILPFHNPDADLKTKSHIQRLRGAFSGDFLDNSRNDYLLARFTFASLMFVSGAYRRYTFTIASDQQDYYYRRFKNPNGVSIEHGGESNFNINLGEVVESRLLLAQDQKPDNTRTIVRKTRRVLDVYENLLTTKHGLLAASGSLVDGIPTSPHFGNPESPVIGLTESEQLLWMSHLTDQIIFAAHSRKGLERVPFLQPVSITEQPTDRRGAVHYPLATAKVA